MSHSSFSQAYHANCLADYEKLHHKMDHYQTHTHPLPSTPHTTTLRTTTSSWSPKFHFPQPYDWHHPDPTLIHNHPAPAHHHFHFPALSTHDLHSHISNVGHLAQPPAPLPTFHLHETPPWVPNADIRETKHAYHIEIELPGVTDKQATTIQWLERGTLCVRGEIRRPTLGHNVTIKKATKGETKADGANEKETEDATKTTAAAATSSSTDSDWCSLSSTHAKDALTNGNPLVRTLSNEEQEAAREGSADASASSPAPAAESFMDPPTFLLRERQVGLWQRTFTLPLDVDLMGLKATLKGGLLEILLMKRCVDMGKCVSVHVT